MKSNFAAFAAVIMGMLAGSSKAEAAYEVDSARSAPHDIPALYIVERNFAQDIKVTGVQNAHYDCAAVEDSRTGVAYPTQNYTLKAENYDGSIEYLSRARDQLMFQLIKGGVLQTQTWDHNGQSQGDALLTISAAQTFDTGAHETCARIIQNYMSLPYRNETSSRQSAAPSLLKPQN